ncbi:MAG: DUF4139 domain-containing protein [Acidobacteria bacterium]|nr:DUF4139 domain-containing protein [Acidobacteriota bacterium]
MRRGIHLFAILSLVLVALAPPVAGQAPSSAGRDAVPLPVRKVVLYKNGMGYFEHVGAIKGRQTVEIVLPSAQLNDVLKSLTVIDLGRGQVTGVTYDSTAPLDRRLRELPIDLNKAGGLVGFLNQIRGTEVEIRAPGGTVRGKLMGAELRTRSTGPGATVQVVEVGIFTATGELRLVDLESAGALRLTDSALAGDVRRYLDLVNSSHQRDVRRLAIHTVGSGQRDLYVSYTSEVPIWKTTYRIVLDPKQKPLLQGWAIVDNTTPMDWENVELSLVAGAPVSFIQNLSQPVYARRPVVPLPQGVQVTPQTHEATLEAPREEQVGGVAFGVPGGVPGGQVGGVMGGAIGRFRDEKEADKAEVFAARKMRRSVVSANAAAPPALGEALRQAKLAGAQAQALGEQFEYKLRQPVTIRRNQSALLLILHTEVEGEKVSLFNEANGRRRPWLAVWLKNSSGLTLDAGSFTVIDTNAFAGEGLMETINPGESRLLSYALDLGVEITTNRKSDRQRVERVEIHRGVLRMHRKVVEKKTYTIRNNSQKARTVVVEHPVRNGWELVETAKPTESSSSYHRFKLEAKPKTTTELVVREENPQQTTYALTNITPEQITLWVRQRSIDREIEQALARIVAKKNEINDLNKKIAALEAEQTEIFSDQNRVRENLRRMGRTPEEANLRQRYIRQLEQQENRLAALRAERARLQSARDAAQKQLDQMLQNLSFDRKL